MLFHKTNNGFKRGLGVIYLSRYYGNANGQSLKNILSVNLRNRRIKPLAGLVNDAAGNLTLIF
jgi:hypothetical protein